jgi:hypothetical protein
MKDREFIGKSISINLSKDPAGLNRMSSMASSNYAKDLVLIKR